MARTFWAVGITVKPVDSGFVGDVEICDDHFAEAKAVHGHIYTYVLSTMQAAIDSVKASAEDLGLEWRNIHNKPRLYIYGDGEHTDVSYPANWRSELKAQADRIGWVAYPESTTA